jgi:hypothetical protein
MSKTQERDTSFSDIASSTIAGQLESRLKELERNIAVARQFIKLADECYGQVRHEWEMLQQDTHTTRTTTRTPRFTATKEEREEETTADDTFPKLEKTTRTTREKPTRTPGLASIHTTSIGAKPETARKKESEPSEKPTNTARETRATRTSKKTKTQNNKE